MAFKFNPFTGTFDNDTVSPSNTSASTVYVTTTGNDSNDGLSWSTAKLTIPAAITALPASGGKVKIGAGGFSVSSSARTDTVSHASGSTFNDASAISGDVGKYVLWGNLGRIAKIISVVAGVSFTVDVLPTTTAATTAKIVTPAIVVPEGVTLEGVGANFNQQLTAGNSTSQVSTQISDSGTGVTILIQGANSVSGNATRYGISKMSVLGNSGNMFGLFVGNGAWYVESDDIELSSHGIAGLALDGNINSHDFRNLIMYGNGSASASTPTGGILTHPYNAGGSASCNIYNAFFTSNFGFGICDGDTLGSYGVILWSPQFNSIQLSAMTNSGSSMVLQSSSFGRSVVVGGWSESAAKYDIITSGDVTVTGMRMHSGNNYHWLVNSGTAYAENCSFDGALLFTASLTNGGVITWNAVDCTDPGLYSGVPSPLPSMGSSATVFANALQANGFTNTGDFTVKDAAVATKAMRFQTSGASLDVAFAAAQTFISSWTGSGFTGTQNFYMAFDTSGNFDAFGVWRFHTAPFASTIVTIDPGSATPLAVTGNISATGTVTGSNLSGTNTGDQTLSGLGGAPVGSAYVTISNDATLTNERALTGTTHQITITDNGSGSTVVLSTPQDIHTGASPTFVGITLSGASVLTSAPSANVIPLTINQNDTTNNPSALVLKNTGSGVTLDIQASNIALGGGAGAAIVRIMSTDAQAQDKGGSLILGGYDDNGQSVFVPFATISGRKENGTTANTRGYLQFSVVGAEAGRIDSNKNWRLGTAALATSATTGFVFIPTCAGIPTGTPSSIPTGMVPMIYDSTNNNFYFYNSGWKKTTTFA